jgi:hypothetical protein
MRNHQFLSLLALSGIALVMAAAAPPAEARCRVWQTTHNGSGLFYPRSSGSAGTAIDKLYWQVEQWRKRAGFDGVRIGKATTKCGESFVKYLVPHRHCRARARVCY